MIKINKKMKILFLTEILELWTNKKNEKIKDSNKRNDSK